MLQRPQALFFDLDDTLLDDHTSVLRSLDLVCQQVIAQAIPSLDLQAFTKNYRENADAFWESGDVRTDDQETWRLMLWRQALSHFDCTDEALVLAARAAYSNFRDEKPIVFDDALPVLGALHRSYPLALITNGGSLKQRKKLTNSGLAHFFDFVVTSDDYQASKPDPGIFHHAAERVGVAPGDAWHVGDSPGNDIKGAVNAGMGAVWLNRLAKSRDLRHPAPHHEIATLLDLLPLLEASGASKP
jgi:putative hydrolase of the HAD superfamily